MDVAVERNAFANRIKAECKHYGKATLNQRDLVAGLQQALATSGFDLMMPVAGRLNPTRKARGSAPTFPPSTA